MIRADGVGVFDDRQGGGHSLIAAAGDDDHRQLTAVHPGIGAGGSRRPQADIQPVPVEVQQGFAHLGAPAALQSLPGDSGAAGNLPLQHRRRVPGIHGVGKGDNLLHAEDGAIRLGTLAAAALIQARLVPPDPGNVGVIIRDLAAGGVAGGAQGDADIENPIPLGRQHMNGAVPEEVPHGRDFLRRDPGEDFQPQLRPAADDAGSHGGFDSPQAAGVGHRDGIDVLDDITADLRPAFHRRFPQRFHRFGGCQRHGNGFRAAQRRQQLFPEDVQITVVMRCGGHVPFKPSCMAVPPAFSAGEAQSRHGTFR